MKGGKDNGRIGGLITGEKLKKEKELRILDYNKTPTQCYYCKSKLVYEKRHYKFCSRSCSITVKNKNKLKRRCLECNCLIEKRLTFCSKNCRLVGLEKKRIFKWESGDYSILSTACLNRILRKIRGNYCEECGWCKIHPSTNKCPLQVHHIDGNASNNLPSNLKLICPNCHSLTLSFGALNKGNGRAYRYNKLIKEVI